MMRHLLIGCLVTCWCIGGDGARPVRTRAGAGPVLSGDARSPPDMETSARRVPVLSNDNGDGFTGITDAKEDPALSRPPFEQQDDRLVPSTGAISSAGLVGDDALQVNGDDSFAASVGETIPGNDPKHDPPSAAPPRVGGVDVTHGPVGSNQVQMTKDSATDINVDESVNVEPDDESQPLEESNAMELTGNAPTIAKGTPAAGENRQEKPVAPTIDQFEEDSFGVDGGQTTAMDAAKEQNFIPARDVTEPPNNSLGGRQVVNPLDVSVNVAQSSDSKVTPVAHPADGALTANVPVKQPPIERVETKAAPKSALDSVKDEVSITKPPPVMEKNDNSKSDASSKFIGNVHSISGDPPIKGMSSFEPSREYSSTLLWFAFFTALMLLGFGIYLKKNPNVTRSGFAPIPQHSGIEFSNIASKIASPVDKFIASTLSELGVPSSAIDKYLIVFRDQFYSTMDQLKSLDDDDWSRLLLPAAIEQEIRRNLTTWTPNGQSRPQGLTLKSSSRNASRDFQVPVSSAAPVLLDEVIVVDGLAKLGDGDLEDWNFDNDDAEWD